MKALTVRQPWAQLICDGIKPVENRTWKTNFRGRILIHASAKPERVKLEIEGQASVKEIEMLSALNFAEENNLFGCIIGSVEIVDCIQNHPSMWAEKGVWNWVLANPVLFATQIKNVKGKLSFWESGHDFCHICGQPADLICAVCDEYFCPECSTPYNQFTQIDYDCCKRCGSSMKESYNESR